MWRNLKRGLKQEEMRPSPREFSIVYNAHLPSVMHLEKILPMKLFHDSLLLTMVLLSYFSILLFLGAWFVLRCVLFVHLWYILVFFKLPPPLKDQGTHTREQYIILIPQGTHTSFTRLSPFSLAQMFAIISL
jgi:hypothetical protein